MLSGMPLGNGMRNPRCPEFRGVQDSVGAGMPEELSRWDILWQLREPFGGTVMILVDSECSVALRFLIAWMIKRRVCRHFKLRSVLAVSTSATWRGLAP